MEALAAGGDELMHGAHSGFLALALLSCAAACDGRDARERASACPAPSDHDYAPTAEERERDEIFSLLAYSVAGKGYQGTARERGYDIASVLVDSNHDVVCWGRNAIGATHNPTEHAELRMLRTYFDRMPEAQLGAGYAAYTTLEPCAMCAGALIMTGVSKVLSGQAAKSSGGVFTRLFFDASREGGQCPYPYRLTVGWAPTAIRQELDALHARSGSEQETAAGRGAIFERAARALAQLEPKHAQNTRVLEGARAFLAGVPSEFEGQRYEVQCPPLGAPSARTVDGQP